MNYNLISKLIFQDFLKKNIECITSTSQLKMYIIAFLVEGSYSYSDSDVDQLVIDVMKFLTVEDVVTTDVPVQPVSQNPISTVSVNIQNAKLFKEKIAEIVREALNIIDGYDNETLDGICYEDSDANDIIELFRDLASDLDIE